MNEPLIPDQPPRWGGDLDDDCMAEWAGLFLQAEKMDDGIWWWCVSDPEVVDPMFGGAVQVVTSNVVPGRYRTGGEARHAAEQAARAYLDAKDRRRNWRPRSKKQRGRNSPEAILDRMSFGDTIWRRRHRRRGTKRKHR